MNRRATAMGGKGWLLCFILLGSFRGEAQTTSVSREDFHCSGDECSVVAQNLGVVVGLLGATVAPLYWGPEKARRFSIGSPFEIDLAAGSKDARWARMLVDQNQIPGTGWGLFTELELVAPSAERRDDTLRFRAGPQLTLAQGNEVRWGASAGLGFSRVLQFPEYFGGLHLGTDLTWDWTEKRKVDLRLDRLFQKGDATRVGCHFYYLPWSIVLGYGYEDNRLTNTQSHFFSLGTGFEIKEERR